MMETETAFRLSTGDDHIAVITLDVVGEKVNTLKAEFADQLRSVIAAARQDPHLAGIVFVSGKKDSFIAGADIRMIDNCASAEEAEAISQQAQAVMAEISALPVPVVAAIHGACLGGGLEFALACDIRICTDDDKTRLGMPEVQLGLLPGAGGTQRLPALIGVAAALPLILTGKTLRPRQALRLGLVDEIVSADGLLRIACKKAAAGKTTVRHLPLKQRLLSIGGVRQIYFRLARRQAEQKSHGHYPAVERILSLLEHHHPIPSADDYRQESRYFSELAMTPVSAALRRLFFISSALKKNQDLPPGTPPVSRVVVLGGGLMGGGIAAISALNAGVRVRIKDITDEGVRHAIHYCATLLQKKVRRRQLSEAQMSLQMSRVTGDTEWRGMGQCPLVIEAVFEDLKTKQQMVAEIEHHCLTDTIFASNTSSLSLQDIARHAERPENIIGLHYFSPVEKMPLAEIIPQPATSARTLAVTLAFARQQGKIPLVVADRPGFYVNRILTPYLNEAMHCLLEGEPVEVIDKALTDFGFPMGPFQLLDQVGIDVAAKISPVLYQAYGERFQAPERISAMINDGRKGRKNGRGFYLYPAKKPLVPRKLQADPRIYSLLNVTPKARQQPADIAQRCVLMMLNEAMRCLDEQVIRNEDEGDAGAVFGIGFPPYLGGPFNYIRQLGESEVISQLAQAAQRYGVRFSPCRRTEEADIQHRGELTGEHKLSVITPQ